MNLGETVRSIYDAFLRGDVPVILGCLAPDVEWEYPPTSTAVPWLQHRVGRDAVVGFFHAMTHMQIEHFAVKEVLVGERLVVALVDITFVVNATGQRVVEVDETHVWRFNEHGQIVRFKHGVDSHRQHLACTANA